MPSMLIFAFLLSSGSAVQNPALLMRPAILNIGRTCRWEARCMRRQEQAMNKSISYVKNRRVPKWKIGTCNRNASRGRSGVDWIGLNNCIRNPNLRPATRRRSR